MSTDRLGEVVISVIVPVKNGLPWLDEQMGALLDQQCCFPWEVIVADNASSDLSADVIEELTRRHPRLRLIDASSVTGAGATRNVAARFARGDILAFCDADDVVHPGWVESWAHALADADLAGGLTDYWSLNDVARPSPAVVRPPPARNQFDYLQAATSGNMAVRRDAFAQVGGFDEDLAVGEDIDLSWRMQLAGYRFTIGDGVISRRERSGTYALLRRSIQFGRCGPVLYKRYRCAGLRRESLAAVRAWLYLIATSPRLFDAHFRRTWVRNAGWRIGRLVESCRRLVYFP
jgi:glycosyltransferase involved in cell wall biosynthesis